MNKVILVFSKVFCGCVNTRKICIVHQKFAAKDADEYHKMGAAASDTPTKRTSKFTPFSDHDQLPKSMTEWMDDSKFWENTPEV